MIVGEEALIGQYNNLEEYDLFFKKIRKKIKGIAKKGGKRIFRPLGGGVTLGSRLVQKIPQVVHGSKNKVTIEAVQEPSDQQVVEITEVAKLQIATDQQNLLEEIAAFEEKKLKDQVALDEKTAEVEQREIEQNQGETKQFLYIGAAAVGTLVLIGLIVLYLKKQNAKLTAIKLEKLAALKVNPTR